MSEYSENRDHVQERIAWMREGLDECEAALAGGRWDEVWRRMRGIQDCAVSSQTRVPFEELSAETVRLGIGA